MMKNNLIVALVVVGLFSITLVSSAPLPIGKDIDVTLPTADKNNLTRWNITDPEVKDFRCNLARCLGELKVLENNKSVTLKRIYVKRYYSYPRKKVIGWGKYADDTPRIKILTDAEIQKARDDLVEYAIKSYVAERVESEKPKIVSQYDKEFDDGKVVIK